MSTLCSAVALLLWVAVCVLWVRSYVTADVLSASLSSVRRATQPRMTSGYVAPSQIDFCHFHAVTPRG